MLCYLDCMVLYADVDECIGVDCGGGEYISVFVLFLKVYSGRFSLSQLPRPGLRWGVPPTSWYRYSCLPVRTRVPTQQ